MKRWYGVRRLYEARFRERLLLVLLVLIGGYYLVWSVTQWLSLDAAALRFDFVNYFGGAQAAAHGGDIYADFKRSWGTQAWVVAYIYPPFFALVLAPLTPLGLVAAGRIWLLVVHLAFFLALGLILRAHPELSRTGRRLFLVAALSFMPVYLNLKFQQVATVWLLLLVGTLLASLRRRDAALHDDQPAVGAEIALSAAAGDLEPEGRLPRRHDGAAQGARGCPRDRPAGDRRGAANLSRRSAEEGVRLRAASARRLGARKPKVCLTGADGGFVTAELLAAYRPLRSAERAREHEVVREAAFGRAAAAKLVDVREH